MRGVYPVLDPISRIVAAALESAPVLNSGQHASSQSWAVLSSAEARATVYLLDGLAPVLFRYGCGLEAIAIFEYLKILRSLSQKRSKA